MAVLLIRTLIFEVTGVSFQNNFTAGIKQITAWQRN